MKAVVLEEPRGIERLKLKKAAIPDAGKGDVLVQLKASALNHQDIWIVHGLYARIVLHIILGSDSAGVIHKVGEGVSPEWLNKKVVINPGLDWGIDPISQHSSFRILGMPDNGTQAKYIRIPGRILWKKPSNPTWEEAAAIPL